MDTGSHLLFGLSLAGLAHLNPALSPDSALSAAVLTVTLIGSHAPDFDSVYRFAGNKTYIKHHRGWSHSLPAMPLWATAIGSLSAWGWGQAEHWLLLTLWALLCVTLHVAFDLSNAYGVQCLLPFRRDWLHLDTLCLTEPFLLAVHSITCGLWLTVFYRSDFVGVLFLGAWSITGAYAIIRYWHHSRAVRTVKRSFPNWRGVHVLPDLRWLRWHYVVLTDEGYRMGRLEGRKLVPTGSLPRSVEDPYECVHASRQGSHVQVMLRFAVRAYVKWQHHPDGGYLVTWTDLRFWRERDWPFRAEVRLDEKLNVVDQKLGWHKRAFEHPYV